MTERIVTEHDFMPRKYRTYKDEGTLPYYVVFQLPKNEPWVEKVRGEFRQIHQCSRDQGRYYQTDGTGHLKEDPSLFDQLNGTSPELFKRSLYYISQRWPRMAKAIEIYQEHEKKGGFYTLEQEAMRHGMSYRSLTRNFWEAIDMLRSLMRGEGVHIREDYSKAA